MAQGSIINTGRDVKSLDRNGNPAWNVVGEVGSVPLSPFGPYDEINVTYPTSTTEVYTYLLSAVTLGNVTVTYVASNKKELLSVEINAI